MGDYEWDAFSLPDLRTDWYVRRLAIEHRRVRKVEDRWYDAHAEVRRQRPAS